MGNMRRAGVVVLVVLGSISFVLGSVMTWANDQLVKQTNFVSSATVALDKPAVQSYLSQELVDAAIQQAPDLIAVRPLLITAARSVTRSDAFRQAYITAVGTAHETLVASSGRRLPVIVAQAGALLADSVGLVNQQAANEIADTTNQVILTINTKRDELGLWKTANRLRTWSVPTVLLGLALVTAGMFLSRNRRVTLFGTAFAVVVCSVVVVICARALRNEVLGRVTDTGAQAALKEVWGVYANELRATLFLVAGLAIVLGVTALAPTPEHGGEYGIRRFGLWFRTHRRDFVESRLRRLFLAFGLAIAAYFCLAEPQAVISVVLTGVGVLLGYLATYQLLVITGRSSPVLDKEVSIRALLPSRAQMLVSTFLVIVLVGAFLFTRSTNEPASATEITKCNGYEQLCDRSLNDVAFLGTHNSMSSARANFLLPYQDYTIREQLASGAHALLIDSYYGIPSSDGSMIFTDRLTAASQQQAQSELSSSELAQTSALAAQKAAAETRAPNAQPSIYLCHVFCELGATPLSSGLTDVRNFMQRNPGEVLILFVEDYVAPSDFANAITNAGLGNMVLTHAPGTPWPTLGSMIQSGRRLVVLSENFGPPPSWYNDGFAVTMDTPYRFRTPADFTCAANRGLENASLFLLNHWIQPDGPSSPRDAANVNSESMLLSRAKQCAKARGHLPNIVAVDFSNLGNVNAVVNQLNGVG